MELQKFRFQRGSRDEFFDVVKQKVGEYFETNGISRYANAGMIFKIVLLFTTLLLNYAVIISDILPWYLELLAACLLGINSVMIIFNVGHDAVHNTISKNKRVNYFLFSTAFLLIGDNGNLWKIRHVESHHNFVNIPGLDVDIEVVSLLRFSEHNNYMKAHRFQWLYAPFIYLFYSLYWVTVSDFKYLGKTIILDVVKIRNPRREFVIWCAAKVIYYGYILAIPIMVLHYHWWQIVLGFLIMHSVNSMFILVSLICTHLFDHASFVVPDKAKSIPHGWAVHHVENCQDFSIKSKLANWILGGENTHTAHHLFPKVAHCHYIPITQIIKETAAEYGVEYHETTLWGGLKSHFRLLKKMGDPETAPVPVFAAVS